MKINKEQAIKQLVRYKNPLTVSLPILLLVGVGALVLASCKQQGPAEEAGEKLDEAAEDVSDAIKDATN
ncbi:MAG: hypothetical protein ACSHX0_13630 [Akkermansiaceae bacterium]